MSMTSNQYSTFSVLLNTSKALITSLERADYLDRLLLLFAFVFFVLCCIYIFKRRVVDKGLKVAGVFGNVIKRSGRQSRHYDDEGIDFDLGDDLDEPIFKRIVTSVVEEAIETMSTVIEVAYSTLIASSTVAAITTTLASVATTPTFVVPPRMGSGARTVEPKVKLERMTRGPRSKQAEERTTESIRFEPVAIPTPIAIVVAEEKRTEEVVNELPLHVREVVIDPVAVVVVESEKVPVPALEDLVVVVEEEAPKSTETEIIIEPEVIEEIVVVIESTPPPIDSHDHDHSHSHASMADGVSESEEEVMTDSMEFDVPGYGAYDPMGMGGGSGAMRMGAYVNMTAGEVEEVEAGVVEGMVVLNEEEHVEPIIETIVADEAQVDLADDEVESTEDEEEVETVPEVEFESTPTPEPEPQAIDHQLPTETISFDHPVTTVAASPVITPPAQIPIVTKSAETMTMEVSSEEEMMMIETPIHFEPVEEVKTAVVQEEVVVAPPMTMQEEVVLVEEPIVESEEEEVVEVPLVESIAEGAAVEQSTMLYPVPTLPVIIEVVSDRAEEEVVEVIELERDEEVAEEIEGTTDPIAVPASAPGPVFLTEDDYGEVPIEVITDDEEPPVETIVVEAISKSIVEEVDEPMIRPKRRDSRLLLDLNSSVEEAAAAVVEDEAVVELISEEDVDVEEIPAIVEELSSSPDESIGVESEVVEVGDEAEVTTPLVEEEASMGEHIAEEDLFGMLAECSGRGGGRACTG